jgi:hypothetical protein
MRIPWPDQRCIICLDEGPLTRAHVIPAAIGGRLFSSLECKACNARLGHAIEARLKSDPCVRFGIEALGNEVPARLRRGMRAREPFVATIGDVTVRACGADDEDYRLYDTPQSDGSVVKDARRARDDIVTTLARRGASDTAIATALQRLDDAPDGHFVRVAAGLAVRKGSVTAFTPDLSIASVVPETCPLAITYRFLALTAAGPSIYAPAFEGVRAALRGEPNTYGWRVDSRVAGRPHQPWHGLAISQLEPHVIVQLRLFGQLAWNVEFTTAALSRKPDITAYQIDLTRADGETFG